MIKEVIGTGEDVTEALNAAKAGLNAPETADVKTEIIAVNKKKFFGLFGKKLVQVKAYYDDGLPDPNAEPEKKEEAPKAKKPAKAAQPKPERKKEAEAFVPAKPEREKISDSDVDLDYVCTYVKAMIDGFKVKDAKVTAKVNDGVVEVTVECDDYGIIIGRRGETLDAIQYLASLAIKNSTDKYARVALNVGDYRAKREETLKALAVKNAKFVLKTKRRYTFEPMNPYERRIIHTAVQEVEGAISRSIGNGVDRRVVIEPEEGVKNYNNSRPKRNNNRGRQSTASKPDPNREKRVDRADIPKFGKIEVNND